MTVDDLITALQGYKKRSVAGYYAGQAEVYVRGSFCDDCKRDVGNVILSSHLDDDEGRLVLEGEE